MKRTILISVFLVILFGCASGFDSHAEMVLVTADPGNMNLSDSKKTTGLAFSESENDRQEVISTLESDSVVAIAIRKTGITRELKDVKLQLRTEVSKFGSVNVKFYSGERETSCRFLYALYESANNFLDAKKQKSAADSLKILEKEIILIETKEDSISALLDAQDYEGYKERMKQMYKQLAKGKKADKDLNAPSVEGLLQQMSVVRQQHEMLSRKKNEMEMNAVKTSAAVFFLSAPHYVAK